MNVDVSLNLRKEEHMGDCPLPARIEIVGYPYGRYFKVMGPAKGSYFQASLSFTDDSHIDVRRSYFHNNILTPMEELEMMMSLTVAPKTKNIIVAQKYHDTSYREVDGIDEGWGNMYVNADTIKRFQHLLRLVSRLDSFELIASDQKSEEDLERLTITLLNQTSEPHRWQQQVKATISVLFAKFAREVFETPRYLKRQTEPLSDAFYTSDIPLKKHANDQELVNHKFRLIWV